MVEFKEVSSNGEEKRSMDGPLISLLQIGAAWGLMGGASWDPFPRREAWTKVLEGRGCRQSTKTSSKEACSNERSELDQLSHLVGRLREEKHVTLMDTYSPQPHSYSSDITCFLSPTLYNSPLHYTNPWMQGKKMVCWFLSSYKC